MTLFVVTLNTKPISHEYVEAKTVTGTPMGALVFHNEMPGDAVAEYPTNAWLSYRQVSVVRDDPKP